MAKKIVETPLMKQYFEMKKKHPDAVLLFRVGDFYETFSDDAIVASEILGITLTRRANGAASSVELAGFPHHALDTYLPRLVRAGKRVAICEQLEDPKLTKKLVKRGITELVTPGVALSDNVLSNRENNFLCAVHFGRDSRMGVAFLDISTGEYLATEGTADYVDKIIANMAPKEVLVERGLKSKAEAALSEKYLMFELDEWLFTDDAAVDRLTRQFGTASLKGFGLQGMSLAVIAAGAIMHYLDVTQHTRLSHITSISRIEEERYVRLDRFTVRNLELVDALDEGGCSLLSVLDRTSTPMGSRLMRRWLLFPLKDPAAINSRLDVVEAFFRDTEAYDEVTELLPMAGDLERVLARVVSLRATPRDLLHVKTALEIVPQIMDACEGASSEPLGRMGSSLRPCRDVAARIARDIMPDGGNRDNFIASGVNAELDELRAIAYSGKDYLMKIQARESEATGIGSLKIGFNNVFGYYIEVTNTHKDKVPPEWIRKQTLVNAERYITPELKEYEEKILTAQSKIVTLQDRIYGELLEFVSSRVADLQHNARVLSHMDVLSAFARVAMENKYVRPVVDDSLEIKLVEARHPVIEKQLPPGEPYISNTVTLDNNSSQIIMITGPNMSGKSALLRQTALNVIMAQTGCFVAAENARIGVVDKVFTRVGASDNISLGESTFMVEMNEAAAILNNMSERSLILFDELGRGTSTYDGISIAWAIIEYIHDYHNLRPKTLFATHYHELNEMKNTHDRIVNVNVSVKEIEGKVVFLRKLAPGGSEHSFGIHVARLAGMPRSIVKRADEILKHLEENGARENIDKAVASIGETPGMQLSFFQLDDPVLSQVRDAILNLDINSLTPLQALTKLNDIKNILTGKF